MTTLIEKLEKLQLYTIFPDDKLLISHAEAIAIVKKHEADMGEWQIWPDVSPPIGTQCEIWLPETGNQFTRFDRQNDKQKPYFYWCGSPKKVWWRYIKPPMGDAPTGNTGGGNGKPRSTSPAKPDVECAVCEATASERVWNTRQQAAPEPAEDVVEKVRGVIKTAYYNYRDRCGLLDHDIATVLTEAALSAMPQRPKVRLKDATNAIYIESNKISMFEAASLARAVLDKIGVPYE